MGLAVGFDFQKGAQSAQRIEQINVSRRVIRKYIRRIKAGGTNLEDSVCPQGKTGYVHVEAGGVLGCEDPDQKGQTEQNGDQALRAAFFLIHKIKAKAKESQT